MAKTSSIARNEKRKRMAAKYAAKRQELKAILRNPETSDDAFFKAQEELQALPRNSSPNRIVNRCSVTGRRHGYLRRFGVSRITFRELASNGLIAGVVKSSW